MVHAMDPDLASAADVEVNSERAQRQGPWQTANPVPVSTWPPHVSTVATSERNVPRTRETTIAA